MSCSCELLEYDHLTGRSVVSSRKHIEVNVAGNWLPRIVAAIEVDRLVPGEIHPRGLVADVYGSHDSPHHVVNRQGHKSLFCQLVWNPRFRVKGVRVVNVSSIYQVGLKPNRDSLDRLDHANR